MHLQAGRFDDVLAAANALGEVGTREHRNYENAICEIACVCANAGFATQAVEMTSCLTSGYYRAETLSRIGVAQHKVGDAAGGARASLSEALNCARSIDPESASDKPCGGFPLYRQGTPGDRKPPGGDSDRIRGREWFYGGWDLH
jgi:hypothetical protein